MKFDEAVARNIKFRRINFDAISYVVVSSCLKHLETSGSNPTDKSDSYRRTPIFCKFRSTPREVQKTNYKFQISSKTKKSVDIISGLSNLGVWALAHKIFVKTICSAFIIQALGRVIQPLVWDSELHMHIGFSIVFADDSYFNPVSWIYFKPFAGVA